MGGFYLPRVIAKRAVLEFVPPILDAAVCRAAPSLNRPPAIDTKATGKMCPAVSVFLLKPLTR
jgi:hypothetical protein